MTGWNAPLAAAYRRLVDADNDAGVAFYDIQGDAETVGYAEIARQALRVAATLLATLLPGERVMLCLPTGRDYVQTLLGCLYAGMVPCTVATPYTGISADIEAKGMRELSAAVTTLRPSLIVVDDRDIEPAHTALPANVTTPNYLTASGPTSLTDLPIIGTEQVHHIQLTSGSTSAPKAVMLTWSNVHTNITALTGAVAFDAHKDSSLSWLPLYHDMGLVQLLTSFAMGSQMNLMQPTAFLREPLSWLRNITAAGVTMSAAPPFALRACVSRYSTERAKGIDLSTWGRLFVGAEPVHAQVLDDFTATFEPHGLRQGVVYPCYGMAETVLATTLLPARVPDGPRAGSWIHTQRLDADALRVDRKAVPSVAHDATVLLSMGSPIPGLELRVRDNDVTLANGEVGEICVRGPSLMSGYDGIARTVTLDADGWFHTGDLGYTDNGHLYVLGRTKEVLIVRGRNYPPHVVEEVLERHRDSGVVGALVFAAPIDADGLDGVVALIETRAPETAHQELKALAATAVRGEFGFNLSDVVIASPGSLPRTTSGKKQRLRARDDYLLGRQTPTSIATDELATVASATGERL